MKNLTVKDNPFLGTFCCCAFCTCWTFCCCCCTDWEGGCPGNVTGVGCNGFCDWTDSDDCVLICDWPNCCSNCCWRLSLACCVLVADVSGEGAG